MRTKMLSLDDQMEELYIHSIYAQHDDNSRDREKMKKMLVNAMQYALTDRQRQCLYMYYFENRPMGDIADAMGLHISTVSRHIKAATVKLKKLRAFVD